MNRLDYLIEYLVKEEPRFSGMQIPETETEKRELFRALRNMRMPGPVSEDFLRLQDEELQAQLMEKGVVELPKEPRLQLWQGDITRLKVDAIVNAANSRKTTSPKPQIVASSMWFSMCLRMKTR